VTRSTFLWMWGWHSHFLHLLAFHCRPAPVQVVIPSFPGTTGLSETDYIFTDEWICPEGSEKQYREKVLRISSGWLPYEPPVSAPATSDLPALRTGRLTFGLFQRPAKLSPELWSAVAEILRRCDRSVLLVHQSSRDLDVPDSLAQLRCIAALESRGLSRDRIFFQGALPLKKHLESIAGVDIALDTFPYNRVTTTCECLWMGVPVVTLAQESHAARMGFAILHRVGLGALAANSIEQYVSIASSLAVDLQALSEIRSGLRERMRRSSLTDAVTVTRGLSPLIAKFGAIGATVREPMSSPIKKRLQILPISPTKRGYEMTAINNNTREVFFWPYGLLNDDYVKDLREDKIYPTDWTGTPGSTKSLEVQWKEWRTATLQIIIDVLWPEWDRTSHSWNGTSKSRMMELTVTDFALLSDLQHQKPMQLDRQIVSTVPGRSTHRDLFKLEDKSANEFGKYFNEYDATLPSLLLQRFPQLVFGGFNAKSFDTDLQIKVVLERPRPYQVALLLGHQNYFYLPAASADTPSMCSGHCMEGLLAVGAVMEHYLLNNEPVAPASWIALEQYAADIGDRRVMAGVHYPSDNLCSWLIAMRLANHVYRVPAVKRKLWSAISQRSFIFNAIVEWVKAGKGGTLRRSARRYKTSRV